MENSIQIFNHEKFGSLRTIEMPDGQIGFVGKDVAEALGYSNTRDALRKHVEEDDKTTVAICDTGSNYKSQAVIINESGLYALVLSSKLPTARKFKHWVTSEVLPQIRKTGGYIPVTKEDDEKTILCKALNIYMNTVKRQNEEIAEKKQQIAELAPLADYADQVLLSPKCYTMTEIAKFEGMTVQHLQHLLHELHIIYRSPSGPFMLYADHLDKGYEAYRTRKGCDLFGNVLYTNTYLVWTETGRKFIHDYLKCPFVNEIA